MVESHNLQEKAVWLYGGIHIVNEMGDILGELNSGLEGNCFAQFIGAFGPLSRPLLQRRSHSFNLASLIPLSATLKMKIYASILPSNGQIK